MQMVYNSDNFAVVRFDVPAEDASAAQPAAAARGGYEIVDKFARKEIFIDGALAESFRTEIQALIDAGPPTQEAFDDYLGRYTSLMQQPLVLH